MTPDKWREVSRIYHDALGKEPDARDRFVLEACRGDEAVRQEVMSLLGQPTGDGFPQAPSWVRDPVGDSDEWTPTGREFGPYRILDLLGAGGMGQVYRARDTKLGRDVAIKFLPRAVASDTSRLARFVQEARLLAALNHPHIGAIYGLEEAEGMRGLVLELVDGETLAERLRRGPLSIPETLAIAEQIADALDAAHEKGIIHRDLKPANVKIRPDGTVKVLDLGLAKLAQAGTDPDAAPTLEASGLSREGMILGTPMYMSPEQARGEAVDKRTDIWAFGCVLYGMLTGEPPFGGRSASDTIAAILEREPDLDRLPPSAPPELRRLLQRCLVKDARRRLRDIGDARNAIEELVSLRGSTPSREPRGHFRGIAAIAAAALLALSLAFARWYLGRGDTATAAEDSDAPPGPSALVRLTYDDGYVDGPALSPDGTLVAYASDRAGADNLDIWLQHVTGGDPIQLTSGAGDERQPSFSPDGGQILFRSEAGESGLYVVPALGGVPRLIVAGGIRGRYSPDGRFIAYWTGTQIGFAPEPSSYRTFVLPVSGGSPREIRGFSGARFPIWSPDGRFLLVTGSRASVPHAQTWDWWLVGVEDDRVFESGAASAFRVAGFEGFMPAPDAWIDDRILASAGGHLWSVRFEPPPGPGIRKLERLTFGPGETFQASASRDGLVAFVGAVSTQNIWALPIESESGIIGGEPHPLTEGIGLNSRATLTADGRQMAFQSRRSSWTILVKDLASGRTVDLGVAARPFGPSISPDGTKVAFSAAHGGVDVVPTRGGAIRKVCDDCEPGVWTPDGRAIAVAQRRNGVPRIEIVEIESGKSSPLLDQGDGTNRAFLSPDERWLLFRSMDAPNGAQVFVAPFRVGTPPAPSEWVPVVAHRERDARPAGWSPGGRRIYFVSSRDGFRCLYARAWDASKGKPDGPEELVRHFHNFRDLGGNGASVVSTGVGNAVRSDQFVFDYTTVRSSIWLMRLPETR